MDITRPCLVRLARRAGIKSLSKDCFPLIREIISARLDKIVKNALVVNEERGTKTLMDTEIYEALAFLGENLARSTVLPEDTVPVKPRKIQLLKTNSSE
jgi:histone H3/H4